MKIDSPGIRAAYLCYDLLWRAVTPVLRMNPRLADGFAQRRGIDLPPPSPLWIQAASVGEAYLAREILKSLEPGAFPLRVLLTANTRQGLDIHRETLRIPAVLSGNIRPAAAYFPFDRPRVMRRIVRRVRPAVAVLLETEIWPGLLRELRLSGTCILILNGRLSRRSLDRYRIWPSFWGRAAPHRILAVSEADASRFRRLFKTTRVGVMPNIKFDRLDGLASAADGENSPMAPPAPPGSPFVILGSVRREEEADTARIIVAVRAEIPAAVIGLFPRHLHRIEAWRGRLARMGVPVALRSGMGPRGDAAAPAWDRDPVGHHRRAGAGLRAGPGGVCGGEPCAPGRPEFHRGPHLRRHSRHRAFLGGFQVGRRGDLRERPGQDRRRLAGRGRATDPRHEPPAVPG